MLRLRVILLWLTYVYLFGSNSRYYRVVIGNITNVEKLAAPDYLDWQVTVL